MTAAPGPQHGCRTCGAPDHPSGCREDFQRHYMTAPGPQQPDEVRPVWPNDREWVPDDEVTCMYCQRYKNRKVCRCGDPNPPVRPAAPSAQPDEVRNDNPWDRRCELGHLQVQGRCAERQTVDGDVRYTFVAHTPAQPVRDTGEGRR